MKIALLNWSKGENDPFTYVNSLLVSLFRKNGRQAVVVELDGNFENNIKNLKKTGIDFAIAPQGLGVNVRNQDGQIIWDALKIPLFCIHADHPCHMISNHVADSDYIIHNYYSAAFSEYANIYISRNRPAYFCNLPNFFNKEKNENLNGDYFFLSKNFDDINCTFSHWKNIFGEVTNKFLLNASGAIIDEFKNGNFIDHHTVINGIITENLFSEIRKEFPGQSFAYVFHTLHSVLDKIHRNSISEYVLKELKDFPIVICGRGWDKYKNFKNKNHTFRPPEAMVNSGSHFYSNYGILDVAPINDILHDRTLRALANKGSFLIGSSWLNGSGFNDNYETLFFNGELNNLKERVEKIIDSPELHREKCKKFASDYNMKASFFDFLKHFEYLKLAKF